jgi:hypothetical protein
MNAKAKTRTLKGGDSKRMCGMSQRRGISPLAQPALALAKPVQSARGAAIKRPQSAPNLIRTVCGNSPAHRRGVAGSPAEEGMEETERAPTREEASSP